MGTVSLPSFYSPVRSALLAPVQAIAAWLMPVRGAARSAQRGFGKPAGAPRHPHQLAVPSASAGKASCHRPVASKPVSATCKAPALSRLKIVREFDAGMAPACAGRMMISGRMADVCAELDRLAQLETAGS